jgi:Zn finger protein HypA/HybF involved in hydrogenase expression
MTTEKPWHRKAFRKRWVQVRITVVAGVLVAGVCARLFAPRERQKSDKAGYKYLHCDQCRMEMTYNPELEGRRCPKCQPPKTGYLQPTESSIKSGSGDPSPWKWVYIASAVDALATLGVVVYLPVPDPTATFFVCNCPHCNQRMRFRQVSLGGLGMCPKCKRPVRFPDEDDAVLEADDLRRQDEQLAAAEAEDDE